jgi:hypothetical protein
VSKYAEVLNQVQIKLGNNGDIAKAEVLKIKETGEEEIRFSWWTQDGAQFQRAPLDMPENDWLRLFEVSINNNVFSPHFKNELLKIINNNTKMNELSDC